MYTTLRAWNMGLSWEQYPLSAISPNSPLWNNPMLPHLFKLSEPVAWTTFNVKLVKDVMPDLTLHPLGFFVSSHNVPPNVPFHISTTLPCFQKSVFTREGPAGDLRLGKNY